MPMEEPVSNKERHRPEMNLEREQRTFAAPLEVRSGADDASPFKTVSGLVVRYGATYKVNDMFGSFNETIHQGAATEVLNAADLDVRFLFDHGGMPYARTASTDCPLVVTEDAEGIHVDATLDTRMAGAADLYRAISNGLITQMSVGMQVDPDGDTWTNLDANGMPQDRDITKLAGIFDTSAVTYPASPTTTISARSVMAYEAARAVRSGRPTQEQGELAMRVLDSQLRAAPTPQDADVTDKITAVKHALADAVASQAKDPDNNTDPVDKKIMAALQQAEAIINDAMSNQAKDGTPDKEQPEPEEKPEPEEEADSPPEDKEAAGAASEDDGKRAERLARVREARSREDRRRANAMRIIKSSLR